MGSDTGHVAAAGRGPVIRAIEVVVDPSPSQQRWLRSYAGSLRAAYNWALAEVRDNLAVREPSSHCGNGSTGAPPATWS